MSRARPQRRRRPVDPVRRVAAEILDVWQREHRHVEDLVDARERDTSPAGAATWTYVDRRRLREIVYGAVRLHGRYDHVIATLSHGGKAPPPRVRAILWTALHELTAMRSPDHAVVHQAVDLAHTLRSGWAAGWINALLRRVASDGVEGLFTTQTSDPREYAATWGSHPRWIVDRWADLLGTEEMLGLCAAGNERPAVHLRAAPGRRDALRAALARNEWESADVAWSPDALELVTRVPPGVLLEAVDESCVVQDAAAQLVAPLLAEVMPPRARVLDLCAAPGGKAVHLAQRLNHASAPADRATVVAADLAPRRLSAVLSTSKRLDLGDRVFAVAADGDAPAFAPGSFDGVLVDAPCTGSGVFARRHDARWVRDPDDLRELPVLQARLLDAALDLVRPGGVVVYATCSLEPEENDEVVDTVLARRDDVDELGVGNAVADELKHGDRLQTWPQRHGLDGAFAARLRRRIDVPTEEIT